MAEHQKTNKNKQEEGDQKQRLRQKQLEPLFDEFHAWEHGAYPVTETLFQPKMDTHTELLAKAGSDVQRASLIIHLQRTYGNRYVQRLLGSKEVQAKLTVSQPGDIYEQEADRVAEEVTRSMGSKVQQQEEPEEEEEKVQAKPLLQRQEEPEEEEEEVQAKPLLQRQEEPEEEEEEVQAKPLLQRQEETEEEEEEEEEEVQAKPLLQRQEKPEEEFQAQQAESQDNAASESLETHINSARGSGHSLANEVREPMEQAFGADFSDVRVHTDSVANSLNQQLSARAFTTGKDVFFRKGEYSPYSANGKYLIAHELTHVVQQNENASTRTKSLNSITSDKEAEVISRLTFDGKEINIDALSYKEAYDYLTKIREKKRGEEAGEKTWENLKYSPDDYSKLLDKTITLGTEADTILCSEGDTKFVRPGQRIDFGGVSSCMTITLTFDNQWKLVAHEGVKARCPGGIVKSLKTMKSIFLTHFPGKKVTKIRAFGAAGSWTYDLKTVDDVSEEEFEQKRINHGSNDDTYKGNLATWFDGGASVEFDDIEGSVIMETSGEILGMDIYQDVQEYIAEHDYDVEAFDLCLYLMNKYKEDPDIKKKLISLLNTASPHLKQYVKNVGKVESLGHKTLKVGED